jgi:transcriptional regulator with XRE-family HTH domain
MTPNVRDFPSLIRWIAETYHQGRFFPMAARIGVSSALIDQWKRGIIKSPRLESIEQLCEAYELDFDKVRKMLRPRARAVKVLMLAAALVGACSAPASAQPLPVAEEVPDQTHYVKRRRRRRARLHYRWARLATCSTARQAA